MLYNLYQFTQTTDWHDICVNMYAEEGDELLPESGTAVEVKYGYAFHPSFFARHDGGWSSRKDSSFTETSDIKRISSLPSGAELDYDCDQSWRSIRTQLKHHIPILGLVFQPRHYLRWTVWYNIQKLNPLVWLYSAKRVWYRLTHS